ncbi:MAG: hypothetical protein KA168_01345 [Chitinophagales bacterium]|nr:hypothetical protein [Chitinophagales bacterium]
MENSKLLSVLRCFDNKQLQSLHDFVASPYFNKRREIVLFYEHLLQSSPDFKGAKVQKEAAYAGIYGLDDPYNEKQMGYLMSDLFALIERFLAIERDSQNEMNQYRLLLEIYQEWTVEKPFHHVLRAAQKYQEKNTKRDYHYYFDQYFIHSQENIFFDKQKKHLFDNSLQKAIDNFDLYYLALKLKYSCEMFNRKRLVISEYNIILLNEILNYLQKNPHDDVPVVAIYASILRCMMENDKEEYYNQLIENLNKYIHFFTIEEARDMYLYAANYCICKVNIGNIKYLNELLNLYKMMLEKNIAFDNSGYLSPWTYINIVTIGTRNKDYEWTNNFIHQYQKHLAPQFRKNAFYYNLAYLYFHQKHYDKTLKLLNEVIFDDVIYSISAKLLQLNIYYELNEHDAFESLCISFSTYLKRNKLITADKKARYTQFIRLLSQLHRLPKTNKKALLDIKQEVEKAKGLVSKSWLLEKIDQKLGIK